MKNVLKMLLVILVFASCKGSADSKVPELANEMCGCFDSFKNNLSEGAKEMMKQVSKAEKAKEVMMANIQKLKPEDSKAFSEQLQSLGKPGSAVYMCMQEFDKKHGKETTKNKKELTDKLLKEMQKNEGCFVGAAIVNLNQK